MNRGQEKQEEEVDNGLRVTYRNMRTGMIEKSDPYILRVIDQGGNRRQLWERPAGSGNLWSKPKDGEAIGRWIYEEKMIHGKKVRTGSFKEGVEHIQWTAPLTEDQKLARSIGEKDAKIQALEKELESIRMETKAKEKPKGA